MLRRSKRPARHWTDVSIAVVFLTLLSAPMVVAASRGFPFDAAVEQRVPAPFPAISGAALTAFPHDLEAWLDDHFAFRNALIRLSSALRLRLGATPRRDVVVGRGGFLFYAGDRALESFRRTARLDASALAEWQSRLESRRTFLAARGIRYLVVFNPDKETIYPELMPVALDRLPGESPLEQLLGVLHSNPLLGVIETSGAVRAAKGSGQLVFHRTDTHWNGAGCFAAANAVLRAASAWFPTLSELPADEVRFVHTVEPGGDLSNMLAMPKELPETDFVEVVLAHPRARELEVRPMPLNVTKLTQPRLYKVDAEALPSAVVLGDSFMGGFGLSRLLAERFQRTFYTTQHDITEELIAEQRPDVVIDGWLERFVLLLSPSPARAATRMTAADAEPPPPESANLVLGQPSPHDVALRSGWWLSTGQDPSLLLSIEPIIATPTRGLVIELQVDPGTVESTGPLTAQLFFVPKGRGLSEAASVHFAILHDGRVHRYRLDLSPSPLWQGPIDAVRVDFPDGLPGFSYRLLRIALEDRASH